MIRKYPNGATRHVEGMSHRKVSKPGELKHLSNRRKRKQIVIPLVVASERGLAQTSFVTAKLGL